MSTRQRPRQFIPGVLFGAAAGIAAGALVLAPVIPGFSTVESDRQATEASQQAADAASAAKVAEAQAAAANDVVSAYSAAILGPILDGVTVGIVALPGADDAVVDHLKDLATKAGGTVTPPVVLDPALFSQNNADQVETLFTSILPAGTQLDTDHTAPGRHTGQVLAAALMSSPTGQRLAQPEEVALIANAVKQANYGTIDPDAAPARVAILVGGAPSGDSFATAAVVNAVIGFAHTGKAVVAVGPAAAAASDGVIGQLRQQRVAGLSTVDSIEEPYAQLAAVAAARNELEGDDGNYGAATDAQAAIPPIPTTPPPGVRRRAGEPDAANPGPPEKTADASPAP